MKITTTRRLGAALLAPALAAGMLLAAPSAQAGPQTDAASVWLAAQIGNDTTGEPETGGPDLFTSYYQGDDGPVAFTDYGVNLDLYTALKTNGDTANADRVYAAVVANEADYTDPFGSTYAGSIAKLATAKQLHDSSDAALITRLEGYTQDDEAGGNQGKVSAGEDDYPNAITQGFGVRALANAESSEAGNATAFLLKQQCNDGSFRLSLSDVACTTGSGSPEVTSFAVQALDVADAQGVGDFDANIAAAIRWLVAEQGPDGSFSDEGSGVPNTNSTGLAAVALKAHGRTGAAASAAGWIAKHQVPSGPETGAIALNAADLAAAKGVEIAPVNRDRYVRASVQAVLGLDALLTDVSVPVTRSAQFVSAGKSVAIKVTGFEPGEKVLFSMPGAGVVQRTALSTGGANAAFRTPSTFGTRTVTVVGSTPGRKGAVAVTVLPARKLSVKPRYTSVKAGKSQNVFVKGLTKGEPIKVYYQRKRIKVGVVKADGTFSYTFKVGRSKGKKTVRINGAFTNRTNSKTFTVR